MRLQFYISGSADSRANDSCVFRSGCPLVRGRAEGRGFLQGSQTHRKKLLKCVLIESYPNLLEQKES